MVPPVDVNWKSTAAHALFLAVIVAATYLGTISKTTCEILVSSLCCLWFPSLAAAWRKPESAVDETPPSEK